MNNNTNTPFKERDTDEKSVQIPNQLTLDQTEVPEYSSDEMLDVEKGIHTIGRQNSRKYTLKNKKSIKQLFKRPPLNISVDELESQTPHFSNGINIYKLLWLCYFGSFIGVIIEMIFWYLKVERIDSRAGLVWGPFNMLYGIGVVLLTLALYPYRNKGKIKAFLAGFVVGTVLEYACSLGQETFLGSVSWDYSKKPLNINGRVCLLYSVFWGVLGLIWIKSIYPRITLLIRKIPQKAGKVLTWVLFAFFAVNCIVTLIAMIRWSQRMDGIAASSPFWEFIDMRFPDTRMKFIFPNIKPR